MKKLLTIVILLLSTYPMFAQSMQDEIKYYQSLFGMDKKAVVASFIVLDEKDDFWVIYDEFEKIRKQLGQERLKTIIDYAEHYEILTDEKTDALIEESITSREEVSELIVKYYKKVLKTSGSKIAAQFYQIENYFVNAVSEELYTSMPLIGELDLKN
jgi:hypothetical protein